MNDFVEAHLANIIIVILSSVAGASAVFGIVHWLTRSRRTAQKSVVWGAVIGPVIAVAVLVFRGVGAA